MQFFLEYMLPAMVLIGICLAHFCLLIRKPDIVDRARSHFNGIGYCFGGGWPITRVGFICWGLMWGVDGLGFLLNGFGVISSKSVPIVFLVGFLVLGVGVFYGLFSSAMSKRRNKKHNRH